MFVSHMSRVPRISKMNSSSGLWMAIGKIQYYHLLKSQLFLLLLEQIEESRSPGTTDLSTVPLGGNPK